MKTLSPNEAVIWPGGNGVARVSGTFGEGEIVNWQYSSQETEEEPADSDFQLMGPHAQITESTPESQLSFRFFLPNGVWIRPQMDSGGDNLVLSTEDVATKVNSVSELDD